jgi:hypothetical protein
MAINVAASVRLRELTAACMERHSEIKGSGEFALGRILLCIVGKLEKSK